MPHANRSGLSPQRLATLDRVLKEKYVDSRDLPGTLIQIWRRGELVHTGMSGMVDMQAGKPMREDAIFRIYSMSKPITAVALMMLVEEGKIALYDDVADHIPSWKDLRVYAGGRLGDFRTRPVERPMKVIDLATHTSGLTYGWQNNSNVDIAYEQIGLHNSTFEGGLDRMVDELSRLPLEFSPGTHYNYSIGMEVLGYLVQKLSGLSYGEFLRTRLFEPLGMVDTGFYVPPEKVDRFVVCYESAAGGGLKLTEDPKRSARYDAPPKLESGGGGLVSTVADYMRFSRMLLNGGELDGVRLLSPKTVEMFHTNMLPDGREIGDMVLPSATIDQGNDGCGMSLCGGVVIDLGHRRAPGSLGEYFWSGAAATNFWIDPSEDLAVVFMTQVVNMPPEKFFPLQRLLRTLVYSAFTESNF